MNQPNTIFKILFILLASVTLFSLSANAQDIQMLVYQGVRPVQFILAQGGAGWGQNLQPPVVSIEACGNIGNKSTNNPRPPQCIGRGGMGKNGFWNYAPWILIHFKGLTIGEHRLYKWYQGTTREGKVKNFKKETQIFSNNTNGWWLWFQSPIKVGKHCAPCWATFSLDGPNNLVGGIEYSGSF